MKEYTTTAVIDASPERTWAILLDGGNYREWNPEIVQVDGRMLKGERITAHVRLGSGVVRRVRMRVTALDTLRRMEWTGGIPFGLFVGRRTFTLERRGRHTEFRMRLEMGGPLLFLILKSVGDRQPEVDSFSVALKHQAERLSRTA